MHMWWIFGNYGQCLHKRCTLQGYHLKWRCDLNKRMQYIQNIALKQRLAWEWEKERAVQNVHMHGNWCLLYKESCQRMSKLGCSWPHPSESYNDNLLEENVLLRISKQVQGSEALSATGKPKVWERLVLLFEISLLTDFDDPEHINAGNKTFGEEGGSL